MAFLASAKFANVGVPLVLKGIVDSLSPAGQVLALPLALLVGLLGIGALHLTAALAERRHDRERPAPADEGWVDACAADSILESRARTVVVAGERVAIFRWDGRIAALSNVCQHQNGPLGEGRIVDDCVTCPWHGYQYRPEDGRSPPPFTEAVPTFAVRVERGRVLVASRPCAPGTPQVPAAVPHEAPGVKRPEGGP